MPFQMQTCRVYISEHPCRGGSLENSSVDIDYYTTGLNTDARADGCHTKDNCELDLTQPNLS